jgi:hypothetical protein
MQVLDQLYHRGINFKDGKEDKYVYLPYAIDILESMDEDFKNRDNYSHVINEHTLSDEQMQSIISKYYPDLQNTMRNEIESYDKHLTEEMNLVSNKSILNSIEKEALIQNLKIMHDYRIQRAKNKIFYQHIVQTIAQFIKNKKIKIIDTPFHEKFWHILETLSGELARGKQSCKSTLNVKK